MIFEKMKKLGLLCCLIFGLVTSVFPQSREPNVVLITLDGFRWQELFGGADSVLLLNKQATRDEHVATAYWHSDPKRRREMLMPFFWSEIAGNGQLLGNRNFGNRVDCDNPYWFSYPGYNEMLTGFIDRKVNSNDKIENDHMTVFEFILQNPGYENKVAAFGTWDVFQYIFREKSSHIPVNDGTENDSLTSYLAVEYMKNEHPKAVFIGLDETDSYAHGGMYDQYLHAAHRCDEIIRRLWTFIQSDPQYRDNTTLIITTDHGRGRGYKHDKMNWRSHGRLAFGSGEVWIAAIGPDIASIGENQVKAKYTLSQVASTIAASLKIPYQNKRPVAPALDCLMKENIPLTAKGN